MISGAGFAFTYVEIDADETFPATLNKHEVCCYLAEKKAQHYLDKIEEKVLVTADTIVCLNNEVINKPTDAADAFQMLRKLSGNVHEVFTGVCLKNDLKQQIFYEKTEVQFHELTDDEIHYYIEHFQPFDKAGSYGVQDWMGYVGVQGINGCFYNVMGFPVSKFYRELDLFKQTT